MQVFTGSCGTKTIMFLCIMSDHCKINFRPEMQTFFIEGNKT